MLNLSMSILMIMSFHEENFVITEVVHIPCVCTNDFMDSCAIPANKLFAMEHEYHCLLVQFDLLLAR
jgi:hypothetical protein